MIQAGGSRSRPERLLRRADLLGPVLGVVAMGGAAATMSAVVWAFPEAAGLPGMCNPFAGDFGCGHGFGCACHMLPPARP